MPIRRPLPRLALLAGAAIMLLVACARQPGATAGATAPLRGTRWRLVELEGAAPAPGASVEREPYLLLETDTTSASGSTGCNRFSGRFTLTGDRLRLGPLAMTRMACLDEALNRQEQALVRALEATDRSTVEGTTLRLLAGDRVVARFVAATTR